MTTSRRLVPVRSRPLGESDPTRAEHLRAGRPPPGRTVTDALLVAAGHGDLDAFAAFYDSTARSVVGLLVGVLDRPADVERMTEQVYLTLWDDAPGFDPAVRSADATLLRTARRALIGSVTQLSASTDDRRSPRAPAQRTRPDDRHLRQDGTP